MNPDEQQVPVEVEDWKPGDIAIVVDWRRNNEYMGKVRIESVPPPEFVDYYGVTALTDILDHDANPPRVSRQAGDFFNAEYNELWPSYL